MNNSGQIVNLVNPTNAQDAATKTYVDTSIPIGGIIMWSGAGVTLPSNWKLCDGTTYNGVTTPDLRGRFVLSSGSGIGLSARSTGQTGGAETVALMVDQMPKHKHDVSASTSGTDGGHTHPVSASGTPQLPVYNSLMFWNTGQAITLATTSAQQFQTAGGNVSVSGTASNDVGTRHSHTITVTETEKGGTASLTASPHENMPPFYALAFIMRVS